MLDRTYDDSTAAAPAAGSREIRHSAGDFSRELRSIGESCAAVLARLNEVTQAKRQAILDMAAAAGERSQPPNGPCPTASLSGTVERALSTAENPGGRESPIEMLELAVAHAVGLAVQNTVAADQQLDILAQAVLARAAASLLQGGHDAGKPR
jgi:hypothetical protein